MSAAESNVPIQVDEEGFDRLEVSETRGFRIVQVSNRGMHHREPSTKAIDVPFKKARNYGALFSKPALDSEAAKAMTAKAMPTGKRVCFLETHDPEQASPQNSKTEEVRKTLKRKSDEGYDDLMRDMYGYGDTSVPLLVDRHRGIHSHVSSAKRYRRRNSFMIHPRHGRGGPFPGISSAIEAALRETRLQLPSDMHESCDTLLHEEPSTIHSKGFHLMDSTNAATTTETGDERLG